MPILLLVCSNFYLSSRDSLLPASIQKLCDEHALQIHGSYNNGVDLSYVHDVVELADVSGSPCRAQDSRTSLLHSSCILRAFCIR